MDQTPASEEGKRAYRDMVAATSTVDAQSKADVKVTELDQLCIELFKQKAVVEEHEDALKDQNQKYAELKAEVISYMEHLEKDKYPVKGHGTLSLSDRFSVRVPKTLEEKKALFEYLKEKGIFFEMASVNSQTLNSFYKAEMEEAAKQGNTDFSIPGVGEPNHQRTLSIRKE
jgi:hypothetical protein